MTDISRTVAPKSDQLNADDLIGGPRTITVTRVEPMKDQDQPVAVYFEGDGGKPYKPGKSMRRVLLRVWGADGASYAGRRMTLYRDDTVQFGGQAVGGIRISHMSGIPDAVTMALTASRAVRRPFTVRPLRDERGPGPGKATPSETPAPTGSSEPKLFGVARERAREGRAAYRAWLDRLRDDQRDALDAIAEELTALLAECDGAPVDDDTFPGDREAA